MFGSVRGTDSSHAGSTNPRDWVIYGHVHLVANGIVNISEKVRPLNDANWLRYSGLWGEIGFSADMVKFTSGPPGPVFVPYRQRIRLRTHRPALLSQYLSDRATGHAPAEHSAVCSKTERFADIRASTGPADFRSLFDFAASEFEVPGKRQHEVLEHVLGGRSDANIAFGDLLNLLRMLGFSERKRGSHRIFWKSDVIEIINLQPKGSKAKPYQVRQVRKILLKYSLGPNDV